MQKNVPVYLIYQKHPYNTDYNSKFHHPIMPTSKVTAI